MRNKNSSFMLLIALSLAALLSGCGSSNKAGSVGSAVPLVSEGSCTHCHSATLDHTSGTPIVADYVASLHNPANSSHADGCQGCHGGGSLHNGVGPFEWPDPLAAERCIQCHVPASYNNNQDFTALFKVAKKDGFTKKCAPCHTQSGVGSVHAAAGPNTESCIGCHDVAAPQHSPGLVGDNNGVRAIVQEFSKWSHHVTGVNLQDAHCAACHLEGKVGSGAIVVDATYHMADNKTHLRNADTDADMQWDPAAPSHSTMDNFCMSCHDANGATSPKSAGIRTLMIPAVGKTASASNPFGDTISNRYDKMQRPAVVDASSQFNTGNNSHHAVKGKRYTGRTRKAGDPRAIAGAAIPFGTAGAFNNNSSQTLQGARSTIYDAGNFNQLYVPLEDAAGETNVTGSLNGRTGSETLGDDSTLHCGDCHTVGQWKVGSSTTALGKPTPAAIGAHGSNNEYLLRNSIGTDERHTQNAYTVSAGVVTYTNPNGAFLVCYNCHSYSKYGSYFTATGLNPSSPVGGPHAGEYDQAGRCNGIGNTLPFNGYTTGTATDGSQFASRLALGSGNLAKYGSTPAFAPGFPLNGSAPVGEQNSDFGNAFGIQCQNCHNAGAGNAYGGIHGSYKNTNTTTKTVAASVTGGAYIDGMGNTNKVERFLPGLGDAMHVPGTLGGFTGGTAAFFNGSTASGGTYTTGGISKDTNWEQKHWQQTASTTFNYTTNTISGTLTSAGAGCYTLGSGAAASTLVAPSVTGAGGAATELLDTWGGCDDHNAAQGKADHGFIKRVVRPVTY